MNRGSSGVEFWEGGLVEGGLCSVSRNGQCGWVDCNGKSELAWQDKDLPGGSQ